MKVSWISFLKNNRISTTAIISDDVKGVWGCCPNKQFLQIGWKAGLQK